MGLITTLKLRWKYIKGYLFMPNYCSNEFKLTGPNVVLDDLWKRINTPPKGEETDSKSPKFYLLNALVPTPEGLQLNDWCRENWGTKWEIDCDELYLLENGDGTKTISGFFLSAWVPPIKAYDTFLGNNPNCSIEASYIEPGIIFGGQYKDGENEEVSDHTDPLYQELKEYFGFDEDDDEEE